MKIAVDAMGGDNAPAVAVHGSVEAASELGVHIILVGNEKAILKELGADQTGPHISTHHCDEMVGMDEHPLNAVRKKKDASIRVAFDLVKRGEADAVVSAGNSGATVAAGVLILGRLGDVERPAIAGIIPGEKGPVVLMDVGANVDCRPTHLFKFGVMAHAFVGSYLGTANPKLGLLSIGEEGSKGNEQVQLARKLFEQSCLNFVGNVEGRDIFTGEVEIIICDGFVGNIALKLSEGMAEAMIRFLRGQMESSLVGRAALLLGSQALKGFKKRLDYEEYGGAPLLGINGVGIICHGKSSSRSIKNAIMMAVRHIENRVTEKMLMQLERFQTEQSFCCDGQRSDTRTPGSYCETKTRITS